MSRVDDVDFIFDRALSLVVLQIAGNKSLRAVKFRLADELRTSAAAKPYALNFKIASVNQSDKIRVQTFFDVSGKTSRSHFFRQAANSAERKFFVAEIFHVNQTDFLSQHVIHAASNRIKIRMRRENRHVIFYQRRQPFTERQIRAEILHRAKNNRVVSDNHLRARFNGGGGNFVRHVKADENFFNRSVETAYKQAWVVPFFSELARRDSVHDFRNVLNCNFFHTRIAFLSELCYNIFRADYSKIFPVGKGEVAMDEIVVSVKFKVPDKRYLDAFGVIAEQLEKCASVANIENFNDNDFKSANLIVSGNKFQTLKYIRFLDGGFSPGYKEAELFIDGEHIVYRILNKLPGSRLDWEPFSDIPVQHLPITTEDIAERVSELDAIKIADWKNKYWDNTILDGEQWSLTFIDGNSVRHIDGSNDYPPNWKDFIAWLNKVIPNINFGKFYD